jgi:hypothetical protein
VETPSITLNGTLTGFSGLDMRYVDELGTLKVWILPDLNHGLEGKFEV